MDKDFVIRSADDKEYGVKLQDDTSNISNNIIIFDDPMDENYMQETKFTPDIKSEEEINNLKRYQELSQQWVREDEEFYMAHKFELRPETEEEIIEHLLRSEDDIENGRVRPIEEVLKEWEEKYGI